MSGELKYTLVVRDAEGAPVALLAGQPVPEWAADLVHSDDLVGGASTGAAAKAAGWSGKTVDELKAEIASRNTGRTEDEQIVPEGKGHKPDLIAALDADDARAVAAAQA